MKPEESFIQQPIRDLQTMLRVLARDDERLPTVVPDGIYGQTTLGAVTEFQRLYGLPMTGVTDLETWDAIYAQYEKALIRIDKAEPIEIIMNPSEEFRLGDEGPYIYLMQSMLIWLSQGHDSITRPDHTGVFDGKTQTALMGFQRLSGLPETGTLDKISWKNLSRQFTLDAHHRSNRTVISTQEDNGSD